MDRQWDDDDRHHPERLKLQWEHARSERAAVSYLVDQLHWFRPTMCCSGTIGVARPPSNVIQGTILARREVTLPSPDLSWGEDTLQTMRCYGRRLRPASGFRALAAWGGAYIYRFHGAHVFDAAHHLAISAAKHSRLAASCRVCPCCGSV